MECTQRLECTQDTNDWTEKILPEQIGFLGICGAKHPVLKGPNKIGRDPQSCSIVLNLNSISRHHAVINVINRKEYMLMDLDSANKTKLLNKTLQPFIPHPIRNGDTVQFGDVFGIFRLLEEEDDLPMTQAVEIPETPMQNRHVSKLNIGTTTMIPESPDVSDKDESFSTPSLKNNDRTRLSSGNFIKPFGKSISIQPISSPKTDTSNSSSKRSISFLDSPNISLNKSRLSLKSNNNVDNIHEMNTQVPYPVANNSTNESVDSIHVADTQIPSHHGSPSIHQLDTQLPTTEHLPQVCKISKQQDMQIDIFAANKENDLSIFNAETQPFVCEKINTLDNKSPKISLKVNKSEEELLFEEIEDDCFEEFNSQPLLPQESPNKIKVPPLESKVNKIVESDSSTDCEDIDLIPTQKVEALPTKAIHLKPTTSNKTNAIQPENEDLTDCEDIEFMQTQKIPEFPQKTDETVTKIEIKPASRINRIDSDKSTDCEDIDMMPTQKIMEKEISKGGDDLTDCEDVDNVKPTKLEDMATQIIDLDTDKQALEDMDTQIITIDENPMGKKSLINDNFEDQPTQIIEEIAPTKPETAKVNVKKADPDIVSPFKIPFQSPIRIKSKEIPKITPNISGRIIFEDKVDNNYYDATQDILEDLCSQRAESPILTKSSGTSKEINSPIVIDDDIVPCSVEDYKVGEKFVNIDRDLSPTKHMNQKPKKNVVGEEEVQVDKLKKFPSDSSSDVEVTPKKFKPFMFKDSDLPNSQEITTSLGRSHQTTLVTESSSDSDTEESSEKQDTPFVHRKKRSKPLVKQDLSKKFEVDKLPERIITRVRKPTIKMEESLQISKKGNSNILKAKFLTEEEEQVDQDIINENVKRLKTYERTKSKDKNESKTDKDNSQNTTKENSKILENSDTTLEETSKESVKQVNTKDNKHNKSKEPKEKIKVKIEKPKKKDTETKSKSKEVLEKKTEESTARKSKEKSSTAKSKEDTRAKRESDRNKSKEDSLHSVSNDKINTRTTRSRVKTHETSRKLSPEDKTSPTDTKRKRPTRKKAPVKESISPDVEIRRSKRQARVKENKSDSQTNSQTMQAPKSILKKSDHEQSTVYNISSSGGETPRNLKRSLGDDIDAPSTKRTRGNVASNVSNTSSINNASLRATPARTLKTQYVLFTAFPSDEVKQKLEKLGAVIVTDVMQCTIVLTMQVKRTFKLLCAVGLGKPIVGPNWVQACVDTHMIVDPWLYLVKDETAEKRFQFNLERTLNGKRNFLKGYNVSSTPSVQPNASEMKLIVECSGGSWKEGGQNWVCVSSSKDHSLWPALRKRGATVVSTEFILGGVLRQNIEITANKFP